jgi:hypothetical protein
MFNPGKDGDEQVEEQAYDEEAQQILNYQPKRFGDPELYRYSNENIYNINYNIKKATKYAEGYGDVSQDYALKLYREMAKKLTKSRR